MSFRNNDNQQYECYGDDPGTSDDQIEWNPTQLPPSDYIPRSGRLKLSAEQARRNEATCDIEDHCVSGSLKRMDCDQTFTEIRSALRHTRSRFPVSCRNSSSADQSLA